jgi:hypothetical protein
MKNNALKPRKSASFLAFLGLLQAISSYFPTLEVT